MQSLGSYGLIALGRLLDLYEALDTDTSLAISQDIGLDGGVGKHGLFIGGLFGSREHFALGGSAGV